MLILLGYKIRTFPSPPREFWMGLSQESLKGIIYPMWPVEAGEMHYVPEVKDAATDWRHLIDEWIELSPDIIRQEKWNRICFLKKAFSVTFFI